MLIFGVAIGIGGVLAILGVMRPRLLVYLMWPVVLAYPHRLTYGKLPMNAGFDDLFILATAACWFVFGKPKSVGRIGILALLFLGIYVLGEMSGFLLSGGGLVSASLKSILKMSVKVAFCLVIVSSISKTSDARGLFLSFAIGMCMAALVAMADWAKVPWAKWFYVVASEEQEILRFRACGAFISPGAAGYNLGLATILVGHFVVHRGAAVTRALSLGACVLLLGTMIAAGSRTAFVSMAAVMMTMLVLSRHRFLVAGCILLAVVTFAALPSYRAAVNQMISRTTEQSSSEQGLVGGSGRGRAIISALKSAGPEILFAGMGETQFAARGWYAHNGFVSFFVAFGLIGLTWLLFMFYFIWSDSRRVRMLDQSPFAEAFTDSAPRWILFSCLSCLTSDPTLNVFWQFQLFWMGAMMCGLSRVQEADTTLAMNRAVDRSNHFANFSSPVFGHRAAEC